MIPIPHLWLGACVGMALALVGGYMAGRSDGRALERGEQDRAASAVVEAREAIQASTAEAISRIEVKNVTIRQQAETVVREVPVYRDCRHDPRGLQSINAALTGEDGPAGGGELPTADTAR